LAILLVGAGASVAQDAQLSLPPPILTIDQDRLVSETISGAGMIAELEARATALADENAEIEAQLISRERELTELRPTLGPDEFRTLADSFDTEVQRIRAEQDEKARAINEARDNARQEFLNEAAGIISNVVRERGALVVLDRRDVFLSADSIDITDEAIRRINAAQGE
ncbi:MAG: OmpH family outer membrane protein, partial [Pseudomonadota bacterium]